MRLFFVGSSQAYRVYQTLPNTLDGLKVTVTTVDVLNSNFLNLEKYGAI